MIVRWIFGVLLVSFNFSHCFKINTPALLLNYNRGLPSNYTLAITAAQRNDCFQWISANPHIVRVTPVFSFEENSPPNCSKKAVLTSVGDFLERKVTRISVTLLGSEKTLTCDVITDHVASIELQSLSEELELGGPPQILKVLAKDKQGHEFSSINGLEMNWNVSHQLHSLLESVQDNNVIRISSFHSSNYELVNEENEFEKRGMFSSSILVEPLQLGTAEISASLLFSSIPVLHTGKVFIKVVPNLKISPSSPLYILRYAYLNFQNEEEKFEDMKIEKGDSCVVSTSRLSAKEYGSSKITYHSKSYSEKSLDVNVVKLHRIDIRISKGNYKTLEQMQIYEISLDLYDEDQHQIFATDNVQFNLKFPTKIFYVIHASTNGTYAVVQAIAPGKGSIRAEFKGLQLQDGSISKEYSVSYSCSILVCQKLSIFPPHSLLPVSQDIPMQIIPLTVTGGTGRYMWALSNSTSAKVVHIEDTGKKKEKIELHVFHEGDFIVTATDKNNVNFVTTAKVSIQSPLDIETYPSVTEAEVGNVLIVPTALLGYEDKDREIIRKFDDCSKADIKVDIVEKYVVSFDKEAHIPAFGKGCISLQFRCKMAGYSRVNMEFSFPHRNETLKTTTVLACYKPLKPVYPVRIAVLALGTSMEIAFEGGPRKWPLYKQGHYADLEASNSDIIKSLIIKDPVRYNRDLTVFRVSCKNLGENTLTLKIGNKPSATLQHPAKSEASIKLVCSTPDSVHLKLLSKKSSKQLKDENIVKVPFYGEKIFSIDIFLKDRMGRKFANISSLRVTWDVSDKTLANPVRDADLGSHENAVSGYRKLTRNFVDFEMQGSTGDLTVKAKVIAYRKEVLSAEGVQDYNEIEEISRSIHLKLVSLRDINAGLYEESKQEKDEL